MICHTVVKNQQNDGKPQWDQFNLCNSFVCVLVCVYASVRMPRVAVHLCVCVYLNYNFTAQWRRPSMEEWLIHPPRQSLSLPSLPTPKYDLTRGWRHKPPVIQSGTAQGRPMLISYTQAHCSSLCQQELSTPPIHFGTSEIKAQCFQFNTSM